MIQRTLNNGTSIPAIGFGTYKANKQEGIQAIKTALECGYRLIDTAEMYQNEEEVGRAIRESAVPREDILITTKAWRSNLGYKKVKQAVHQSLKRLQVDEIDIYLIHWPAPESEFDNWKEINQETWQALEELQREGKLKYIGVSNFLVHHLKALLENATVTPVLNQIEFHPGYMQSETVALCKEHDILVEAWSPLARGESLQVKVIHELASKYNKTEAQICLRWAIEHGAVPIPKSSTASRIKENIELFDFSLSPNEVKQIDAIPTLGFSGHHPDRW